MACVANKSNPLRTLHPRKWRLRRQGDSFGSGGKMKRRNAGLFPYSGQGSEAEPGCLGQPASQCEEGKLALLQVKSIGSSRTILGSAWSLRREILN